MFPCLPSWHYRAKFTLCGRMIRDGITRVYCSNVGCVTSGIEIEPKMCSVHRNNVRMGLDSAEEDC